MAFPVDPSLGAVAPVAQFLAEAALQRQASLLGPDKAAAVPAVWPGADAAAPPPTPASAPAIAAPLPVPADKASISAQAHEQLGAGFDPRRVATDAASAGSTRNAGLSDRSAAPLHAGAGARAPAGPAAPLAAASAAWPATGLGAPLMRLVSALVQQVTAGSGAPQRVVSAQPWPVGLAQALESGTLDADQPPLQTWLVRQGVVQTPEGARGLALTLRAPVPWLASHAATAAGALAQAAGGGGAAGSSLQVPFAGSASSLQSGVFALVLQGMDTATPRTSALLVIDLQPQQANAVYGREMLLQPQAGRLDPWTQMAILQASGQVPGEEERARPGRDGDQLCDTVGCPYVARAACVQPFCLALRCVPPAQEATPLPR